MIASVIRQAISKIPTSTDAIESNAKCPKTRRLNSDRACTVITKRRVAGQTIKKIASTMPKKNSKESMPLVAAPVRYLRSDGVGDFLDAIIGGAE